MRVFPSLNKEAVEVIGAVGDAPDLSCGKHLVNFVSSEALSKNSDYKKQNYHESGANLNCSLSKLSSATKKPTEAWTQKQHAFAKDKSFDGDQKTSRANKSSSKQIRQSSTKKEKVFPSIQQKLITAEIARNQNKLFFKCPPVHRKDYSSSTKKVIGKKTFPEAKAKPIVMNL